MSNEPQTGYFIGIDSLARFQDAPVFIVDAACLDDARAIFPSAAVLGMQGAPNKLDALNGRRVYLWTPYADRILDAVRIVAAETYLINGNQHLLHFGANTAAARLYASQNRELKLKPAIEATLVEVAEPAAVDLQRNREGTPVATLDNCVKVLERDPLFAGKIWYDTFLAKILHRWGVDIDTEWADHNDIALALHFQRVVGIPRVTSRMAGEAVVAYAMREKRNCAYDWLDGLEWDQQPRLRDIAVKGFGTPGNPYEVAVCRNLILSMVKRIFEPGCKSDYMPIFEGPQGVGKSRALGIIGGAWFAESHESVTSKDFYGVLQGKWLIEIAEMHAFKQADVDKIKGIVSCAVDRYRVPYGRHTADHARQCSFAGTTNRDDWNRDDTGARRFWPIKCGRIDHDWLIANREQLFAEAVSFVRYNDEAHWVVPWDTASSEQEDRRHEDTWEIVFEHYVREEPVYEDFHGHRLDQPTWTVRAEPLTEASVFNFLTEGMNILPSRIGRGDEMRAARAMKMCGWHRVQKTVGAKRIWIYMVRREVSAGLVT